MAAVEKVTRQATDSKLFALLLLYLCSVEAYTEVSMFEYDTCPQDVYDDAGVFYTYPTGTSWLTDGDSFECEATVSTYTYHSKRYYLSFEEFSVPTDLSDCSDHKLEIYDGLSRDPAALVARLCDESPPEKYYLTSGNSVTVYLYRGPGVSESADFRLKFVGFNNDPDPGKDCFDCKTDDISMCIDETMKCDFNEDCPNGFDESLEDDGGCGVISDIIGLAVIIGIVIAVIIGLAIVIGIVICCCCCYGASQAGRGRNTTTVVTTGGSNPAQTYAPGPQTGYPTQPGYQPPPGGYQQPQGAYPPPQGAYPPPQGAYPPPQGAYPPPQGAYPPQPGYPPQQPPPGYPGAGQGVGFNAEQQQVAFPQKE